MKRWSRRWALDAKPAVIADQADNPGGGAPSDSTFVLRELLERGIEDVALGMIWDPVAVKLAQAAGEGAELSLRLGGKMGPMSGDPLDLDVTVRGLIENMDQYWTQSDGKLGIPCGDSAALHCRGIDIIVNSERCQVLEPDGLQQLRHRPTEQAPAGGEIHAALLCRLRADSRQDHLHGWSWRHPAALHRDPVSARGPAQVPVAGRSFRLIAFAAVEVELLVELFQAVEPLARLLWIAQGERAQQGIQQGE